MTLSTKTQGNCNHCQESFLFYPSRSAGLFCSIQCRSTYVYNVGSKKRFLDGEAMDRPIQKRFVVERDGYSCQTCSVTEWQGKPISLHLDHTDGDAANNHPDNLRLLCPNCHSQTPSFGGKNKGKGRKAKGLPTY